MLGEELFVLLFSISEVTAAASGDEDHSVVQFAPFSFVLDVTPAPIVSRITSAGFASLEKIAPREEK